MNSRFREAKLFDCRPGEIDLLFDAYFLPEPTYVPQILAVAEALRDRAIIPVLLLAYDIIPISEPWLLHGRHQMRTDGYFRLLASAENVAYISAQVGRDIETRLRRGAVTNGVILPLGADGLGRTRQRQAPLQPMFVTIGTVEPRKNIPMLLEAMRTLWAGGGQHRLTLIGAPGREGDAFLDEFRKIAATDSRVTWFEAGDDDLVKRTVEGATALVFASEHEGFGLPPLEALSLGVPVIAAAQLPALEGLSAGGQVRLPEMTPQALAEALTDIAVPRVNRALRRQIDSLDLPVWRDFYEAMSSWVANTIHQAPVEAALCRRQ
ncbi:glycosyltransferase [Nocardioides sp.]|uniref:glycosyltransferase n=1 Tax=Nocardioides sp. TaxID=35761 RepID=UPI00260C5A67|nr:glycosyltransferase [Nocardioides sp.]MDI6910879.1 glycosyltransferase [Nocardioides sp.]